ncbi:hypothetical protein LOK49_LG13G00964 [Camellia lanceoleosa]|uniref:Uncharacterized protein n=1 Tax=Camellia lanceoleosa TaxID=1840588 RepID=A0ACC0FFR4_9ERIC|nr:hypothetical protein LOK49_LG13G00964 [Camellia lanceoleosa]
MAESGGYSPPFDYSSDQGGRLAAISDEEGTVAADFPDDFKEYVDAKLNSCPVVDDGDDDDDDILCGLVFWSREDDQSEHPPRGELSLSQRYTLAAKQVHFLHQEGEDGGAGVQVLVGRCGWPLLLDRHRHRHEPPLTLVAAPL